MDSPSAPNAPVANGTGASERVVWTRLTVLLLVVIAFLLALTTARNADLWAHLASGRDVVSGTISRPFSWLADLVAYLAYSASSALGLILGKCILFAATVLVMLGREPSWRALLCVFLATLAMGGAIPLNPTCVSFLLLTVSVIAFDQRAADADSSSWREELRSHWSLLACFVVWANVDIWSLLGVAVIGVRVLTRTVVHTLADQPPDRGAWRLFLLVLATQAISLMPWNLSAIAREFGNPFAISEGGIFPFRRALFSSVYNREFEGLVPVYAFWLLVCVAGSSFIMVNRNGSGAARRLAWERFIPVVGLFVAATLDLRFVPFFVVVCGVSGVQNFRSLPLIEARPLGVARPWTRVERIRLGVQCLCAAFVAIALLAASWAGWFQTLPSERRNWTLEPDPSLVKAAEQVEQWYASGLLTAEQETVFFATDAEDTFAWFAPRSAVGRSAGERGPAGVARVRTAIFAPDGVSNAELTAGVLGNQRVGCIVLCDASRTHFTTALRSLTDSKGEWVLAHLRGRVAVFVRRGTGPAANPVELSARAFSLASADRTVWSEGAFAVRQHWSDPFMLARPPRSIDRDEAITYLLYEEATRDHRMVNGANRFLAMQMASVTGAWPPGPAGWVTDPRVVMLTTAAGAVRPPSEAPPPLPFGRFGAFLILTDVTADHYLAVRAARRGIAASPRDAASYEALGEAYLHLLSDPLEASWSESVPTLRRLRLTQAAAAFWQAVAIEPNRATAHLGLATTYFEQQILDLAAKEFRAYERFARIQGQQAADAMERTRALERAVESAQRVTEANSANLSVIDRARLAARNGLTGQALDILLQSDVSAFGAAGIALELDLLLAVGRVTEAREWLAPEHRKAIGAGAYDWLEIQSAAAVGNYAKASTILRNQIATSSKPDVLISGNELLSAIKIAGEEVFLKKQNAPKMIIALFVSIINQFADSGRRVFLDYQARSEGYFLLALLAMEQGDVRAAQEHLQLLHDLWDNLEKSGIDSPAPQRFFARQMRALIRD